VRLAAYVLWMHVALCSARELHVSPSGDDDNAGTATQPFRTLERALQAAAPGTTVWLAGGRYEIARTIEIGPQQSDIVLRALAGQEVRLSGGREVAPERAYLTFDRLEALAIRTGNADRFTRLCRRLIDENPQDWRARLALSRHLAAGGHAREALDLLFAALVQNPHALSIHQAIWRALGQLHHPAALVDRYGELTEHAVFYLDPHICTRCRYRSTELLWQCPHCHDWNTFVEERIAPAQDTTEVEV